MIPLWKSKEQMKAEQEYIKGHCSITDYARILGYHVLKIGRYYTLQEHDSVRIDPEKNCFWQNSVGVSGSVIDFVMCFSDMSFQEAIKYLLKDSDDQLAVSQDKIKSVKTDKTVFVLPPKDTSMRHIFAYLTQYRKLPAKIVQYWVRHKILYQDTYHNCVFVGYNDKKEAVFACKRGTLTDVRYVGDVPGSDYQWCIYLDHGADKLIVCESAIDAMSLMAYLENGEMDLESYDYLVLASTTKYQSLYMHMERLKRLKHIYLALDNDVAGFKAMLKIQEDLADMGRTCDIWMPRHKDWNDDWKDGVDHAACWKS